MLGDVVVVERAQEGYAVVTLNRPQVLNALSSALRRALCAAVDALGADPAVRVLILTGAGRGFCSGLDLKELGAASGELGAILAPELDPVRALERFAGPVIGAINGVATTGGFELALACDVLVASTEARFADTHTRVGILPGWGLSQKLSRAIGLARAKELSLTGNFLSAELAERWGLVNRVVPPPRLLDEARRLALDMLSAPDDALRAYKRLIDDGWAMDPRAARALEAERSRAWLASVRPEDVERRRREVRERGHAQTRRD